MIDLPGDIALHPDPDRWRPAVNGEVRTDVY
jgi:hypothetical protein